MRFLYMSQLYSELRHKDTHFFGKNAQCVDNFTKFWLIVPKMSQLKLCFQSLYGRNTDITEFGSHTDGVVFA